MLLTLGQLALVTPSRPPQPLPSLPDACMGVDASLAPSSAKATSSPAYLIAATMGVRHSGKVAYVLGRGSSFMSQPVVCMSKDYSSGHRSRLATKIVSVRVSAY